MNTYYVFAIFTGHNDYWKLKNGHYEVDPARIQFARISSLMQQHNVDQEVVPLQIFFKFLNFFRTLSTTTVHFLNQNIH